MTSAGLVLGLDFGATKFALAVADRHGNRLGSQTIGTRASHGARQAVERTIGAARHLAACVTARHGGQILAAGAGSPGIVLPDRILMAPGVPGWEDLKLAAILRDGLGIGRLRIGNDVKAAGLAEARWGTLAGIRSGIFLNLGTGLAAAVVIDGRGVGGVHGAAGEIGYQALHWPNYPAHANGHAPLGEYVSGRALASRGTKLLGHPVTAAGLFAAAGTDKLAHDIIHRAVQVLAAHTANLAVALDPARIALGGGLTHHAETIMPVLRAALDEVVPFPPEVTLARFTQDAPLAGAIALAIDAAPES